MRSTASRSRKPARRSPTPMPWTGRIWSTQMSRAVRRGLGDPRRDASCLWFTRFGGRRMETKRFASSARAKRAARSAKPMPVSRIDFSDIPESTDEELKRARRVGRPRSDNAKQLIAIRIAPQLLMRLRRMAAKQSKPYQTLIHELLERAAKKRVA